MRPASWRRGLSRRRTAWWILDDPVHRQAREGGVADDRRSRATEPGGLQVEALGVPVRPRLLRSGFLGRASRRADLPEGQRDPYHLIQPAGRRGAPGAVLLELERPLERPHPLPGRESEGAVLVEQRERQSPLRDPVVEHPLDREDQSAPGGVASPGTA
jgi:hypothetical protein